MRNMNLALARVRPKSLARQASAMDAFLSASWPPSAARERSRSAERAALAGAVRDVLSELQEAPRPLPYSREMGCGSLATASAIGDSENS